MTLPSEIENEIQELEYWFAKLPIQQAGPPRFRGLREVLQAHLQQAEADQSTLRQQLAASEARLRDAERRVYADPDLTYGCDGADHLAELVLAGRQQLAEMEKALVQSSRENRSLEKRIVDLQGQLAALQGVPDPVKMTNWYPCSCGAEHSTPICPFGPDPTLAAKMGVQRIDPGGHVGGPRVTDQIKDME